MQPRKENIEKVYLENPPTVAESGGFDCKHYAVAAVLQWLYSLKLITQKPAPARRRQDPMHQGPSLRFFLKTKFNSAVGEVHNVEDLAAVAETQEQVAAHFCQCTTQETYNDTLKMAIDQGLAPIIFYDIDLYTRGPVNDNGRLEHAAIVVGYYYNQETKSIFFRIAEHDKHYDFDAVALFRSTSQLPQERSERENYIKIKTHRTNEGAWLLENVLYIHESRIIKNKLETSPARNGGVRQKILILDSTLHPRLKPDVMPVKFNRPQKAEEKELPVAKRIPPIRVTDLDPPSKGVAKSPRKYI